MSASDPNLSTAALEAARSETEPITPARAPIDWRALRFADRSCCCAARPAVAIIMPAPPGRTRPTDLLLCGHHYRASQTSLAGTCAAVFTVAGAAVTADDLWTVGANPGPAA
jgi:hypothetical protein